MKKALAVLLALVAAAAVWYFVARQAANSRVVGNSDPGVRIPMDQVDHTDWSRLLHRYVDDAGMVNYRGWKASSADTERLKSYLGHLGQADPKLESALPARLAFWINAYNALTVLGILNEYPTTSIRNHTSQIGYNIWQHLKLRVAEGEYSLDDIEHQILRKMGEPRIHFAIVCASIGCPKLRNQAYTGDQLEEQLVDNTKHFFAQDQNFRLDADSGTVHLSSILDWFGQDFGPTVEDRLKYISQYVPQATQDALQSQDWTVQYLDYDWNLNEQR